MTQIYHNPRCRKSRETLALLEEKDIPFDIRLYLEDPPSRSELLELLSSLDVNAEALVRKGEAIYKENYKGKTLSEAEWLDCLLAHPKLIERPIVLHGKRAAIGRPPEAVLALFE